MADLQISDFQETFNIFDTKGDGCIDFTQVGDVLRAMGQNPTQADIGKCTESLDPKVRITWETFVPILQSIMKNKDRYSFDDIVEGLRHFDNDGSGYINAAELRHLLTALGEKLTEDEVEQLMEGVSDEEGKVNYETFIKEIMKG